MLAYATLLPLTARTHDLLAIVADWLSQRTAEHWNARRLLAPGSWRQNQVNIRTALMHLPEQTVWGLQVATRDLHLPSRTWQLELTLRDLERGGVRATVVVHALDGRHFERTPAPVPFTQPALVQALLEHGAPDARTPGLHPRVISTESGARSLVELLASRDRRHGVLVLSGGETTLDVPNLQPALIGLAELVDLRPVLPPECVALLKPAGAWPPPARVIHFTARAAGSSTGSRESRVLLTAETRTLAASLLRHDASRILAQHLTLEQLQKTERLSPVGGRDV